MFRTNRRKCFQINISPRTICYWLPLMLILHLKLRCVLSGAERICIVYQLWPRGIVLSTLLILYLSFIQENKLGNSSTLHGAFRGGILSAEMVDHFLVFPTKIFLDESNELVTSCIVSLEFIASTLLAVLDSCLVLLSKLMCFWV